MVKLLFILFVLTAFPAFASEWKGDSSSQTVPLQIQRAKSKLKQHPEDFQTVEKLIELYLYQTNYDEAQRWVDRFLSKKISSKVNHAKLWMWKAEICKFKDRIDEAYYYYMSAKKIFISKNDWKGVVICNSRLMEFYRRTGKHQIGIQLAKETDHLIRKYHVKDPFALNLYYNRFAALLNEQSQGQKSLFLSRKALVYADQSKDLNAMAVSYNEMGFTYKNLNKVQVAISYYKKAEDLWKTKGYLREAINAEYNIVIMKAHNNLIDLDSQITSFHAILEKANKYNIHDYDANIYSYISTSYGFKGDLKNEYKYYKISADKWSELASKQNDIKLKNAEEKFQNKELQDKLKDEQKQKGYQLKLNKENKRTIWVFNILTVMILLGLGYSIFLQRKVKKSYKQIKEKDEQKNVLIAEIHHRVKNNLQYVRSMLEMQLSIISKEKDKQNLEDVSRRIQAMSLVHEMLYNKEETIGIDLHEYLNQLFTHLSTGFSSENEVSISIHIPKIEVSITEATSLGIVCAELFNNSVKYAFHKHSNPCFSIDIDVQSGSVSMTVKDNGKSKSPTNEQDESRQKLGMRIIDIFARQLKATYKINKEKGYVFELSYARNKLY